MPRCPAPARPARPPSSTWRSSSAARSRWCTRSGDRARRCGGEAGGAAVRHRRVGGVPDHLHCVWTLSEGDADFPTRWRLIKSRFSRGLPAGRTRASHEARREKGIWQRRFWEHHIRDEADYVAHVRYCWINPVKHGFVESAVDWRWSSIHRDMRRGMVEPEWSGSVPDGDFAE